MLNLKFGNAKAVIQCYGDIVREFPITERKSLETFQDLYETGHYKLVLGVDDHDQIVGFAYVYCIEAHSVLWLDFIVINPEFQGMGYGTVFIHQLKEFFSRYEHLLLEVEIPNGEDENQFRRIRYYERLGAQQLKVEYFIPNPHVLQQMYLYWLPLTPSASEIIDKIIPIIESVYAFIHADISDTDSLLEMTKNSMEELI